MSDQLESQIATAPVYHNNASYDRAGILEAMQIAGVGVDSVVAVSQCQFGTANIEALVDADTIAFVHPTGVICTAGKRKMIGKTVKFKTIDFGRCLALRRSSTQTTADSGSSESSSEARGTSCPGDCSGRGGPSASGMRPKRSWLSLRSAIAS